MPVNKLHGLYFGMPGKHDDRDAMNRYTLDDVRDHGTDLSRSLMVVSPHDDVMKVADQLKQNTCCGIKVYHCYADRKDTMNAEIAIYAKAMSNGVPLATVAGSDNVMTAADESFISSSYRTDGIGTAAALAVLEKMESENIFDAVWAKGVALQEQLREIAMKYVSCGLVVGGMPASPTFTFTSSYAAARKLRCRRKVSWWQGFFI
ncbi:aminotransferase class III-fold pyridoxal phosphate-dependent enzyme [Agriterribacter sp.]|uniref:aminotransferase class III-fold pyridoxal phosphate-dependent enzyme n=1 Tax=Agriterribacter sp. TaxID=2821509 RepID=UPI002CE42BE4|nr:aminotransferase class III-fold pyridoxal phosphate-dependent enzyme [Agriterribacter sp.]HRP57606.1 aminotransferase class III-fold pyridoxal phosphate-dependent enzyme [Agriterribacter sp.]